MVASQQDKTQVEAVIKEWLKLTSEHRGVGGSPG